MRNEFLLALSMREKGDWSGILKEMKEKKEVNPEEIYKCYSKVKGDLILFKDQDYPDKWNHIVNPPLCVYTHGNKKLLSSPKILAVIGSRKVSQYGDYICKKLINELLDIMPEIVIVSGCAMGIDSIAMRQAMNKGGKVIGVSGAGIESVYPLSSKDIYDYCKTNNGLLLSEYPCLEPPESKHFPMRNRLISGICDAILVIEGDERSGTSISVGYGIDQGKTIMAVPRDIRAEKQLTNKLIRDGANPVLCGQDIADLLVNEI